MATAEATSRAEDIPALQNTYAASDIIERAVPLQPSQTSHQVQPCNGRSRSLVESLSQTATVDEVRDEISQDTSMDTHIDNAKQQDQTAGRIETAEQNYAASWKRVIQGWSPFMNREEKIKYDQIHGYDKLTYTQVDKCQKGFSQLSAFIDSDDEFAIARRFGSLSSRVLIQQAIDLADLEQELNELDAADMASEVMKFRLHGLEGFPGWDAKQRELMGNIQRKLREYKECLLLDANVRALGQASPSQHRAVFTWMWNEKPLAEGKDRFIHCADDFVVLNRSVGNRTPLRKFLGDLFNRLPSLKRLVQTQREANKTNDPNVDYHSEARITAILKAVTVSLTVGTLLIPVLLLFLVDMAKQTMAWIVIGFVVAFSGTMTATTDAKTQELFVGTAAYAAVLVTFLGNLNVGGAAVVCKEAV
ncbi:hypothetical protein B0O99DRAFT_684650 [Bisporella sp. PMI_857]|nr:hypothetical protein B0O99DRAFT_684650 [Bisporella sp. PMI_857]